MNPEKPSREEIEAKLTALLLGELPAEEAQLLQWAISQDAALAQLHERLKLTVGFVREVAANPAETIPAPTAPLKLSGERREKLLAHFKTIAPREFVPLVPPLKKHREISPLLAMAAAIAIIGVLAAMLLPSLASAKRKAQRVSMTQSDKVAARAAADSAQLAAAATSMATPPPTAPPVALDQRVSSLEAYVANGDPTARDRSQNKTVIVLPASGAVGDDLAVASPAPSELPSFDLADSRTTEPQPAEAQKQQNADDYERVFVPEPAHALDSGGYYVLVRKKDQTAVAALDSDTSGGVLSQPSLLQTPAQNNFALPAKTLENSPTVAATDSGDNSGKPFAALFGGGLGGGGFGGGARGGRGGAGGGGAFQQSLVEAETAAASVPSATASSSVGGYVDVADSGASPNYSFGNKGNGINFNVADIPSDVPADKVPVLGDVPEMGSAFKSSAKWDGDIDATATTTPAATVTINGNILSSRALAKSGSGTPALNASGGTLNLGSLALSGANTYSGGTTVSNGTLTVGGGIAGVGGESSFGSDQYITSGLRNDGPAQDEKNKLAYDNNGTVGTAQISVDPDSHNLVATADSRTEAEINDEIIRHAKAARAQAGQNGNQALGFDWYLGQFGNREVVANDGSAPSLNVPASDQIITAGLVNTSPAAKTEAGTLVQDGKLLYEMGKVDEATAQFNEALKADPNNQAATYYLRLYKQTQSGLEDQKHTVDTDNRMVQVEEGWVRPRVASPAPAEPAPPEYVNQAAAEQLQSERIPLKYASPANMQDAIQSSLTDGRSKVTVDSRTGDLAISGTAQEIQSAEDLVKKLDTPTRQVLVENQLVEINATNIVRNGGVDFSPSLTPNSNIRGTNGVQGPYNFGFNQITGYVTNYTVINPGTPSATIVPTSITPIKSDAAVANSGFALDASAPAPNGSDAPQLYTRTFKVDPNTFYQGLQSVTTFSFGSVSTNNGGGLHLVTTPDTNVTVSARNFFGLLGVDLSKSGKGIFFNDRLGQLFVRGTEEDLDTIQRAVQIIASSPAAAPVATDVPLPKTPSPAPVPTPEILTRENAFSTFSLNVSDVSFKLAAASLEKGVLPDVASIRSEEFLNAFNYHDPEPMAGVPVAFVAERARDPFAHNRDLLRFSVKTAAAGREAGRPLNIVLLLDNSGSMERADRVAIIHEALKVLASQLQPQDTLSIVTFARTARLWVDGARGDQAGTAVNKVSDLVPEGGTNLEEAMNLAYATARRHYLANGGNRVVLLTDGAANLGNVDPEALKQKVEAQRKQGIALDCFGIGWEGFNDDLLEVLSSNGDGRYGFINTPEAATTEFAAQLAGALHVAAEDVKVQVEFNPARVTSYRQIGYAKHQLTKQQFRDNTVDAAEIAAQEAGNALYTVEVNPSGVGPLATVRVRYKVPGTANYREQAWVVPFEGNAPALEQSSTALRLAATASAFSEWLAQSQFAQEVTTDRLLNYLNGVPAVYGADARPKQLETMIREAKSLSGK